MMPNVTRGDRFGGLVSYLLGPGRSNEHTDPHIVAGDIDIFMTYGGRDLDPVEAFSLAHDLDESRRLMGTEVSVVKRSRSADSDVLVKERKAAHVWHASLSIRAEEGELSDSQWNAIATDFMDEMGFTAESGKAEARWVAVRHGLSSNGNDHIHIAASVVRTDGTKVSTHNDFARAQKVCRDLEVKYGLEVTGDRALELGTRGVKPSAREAAKRRGAPEPDALRLARVVRGAAASATDEGEFVRRVRRAGVLIRPRFAAGRRDVVEGYSVALRAEPGARTVWHGGGKIARDLTLPRLRNDWSESIETAIEANQEWQAAYDGRRPVNPGAEIHEADPTLWKQYTTDIRTLRDQLREVPFDDHSTWAVVARDAAGVFAAWSQRIEVDEHGPLAKVSAELARSAQIRAHKVQPRRSSLVSVGNTALLVSSSSLTADSRMAQVLLMRELARLAQSLHSMMLARGAARRAEEMRDLVKTQLSIVTGQLDPAIDARASASPALTELGRFEANTPRVNDSSGIRRSAPGELPNTNEPEIDR